VRRVDDLPCPPGLPLLGNARQITPSKFHATLENWAKQYGPLYRFRMLGESVMVINDHRLLAELLRDRPEGLARSRTLRLTADELGANGVFSAEGERWRNQRKLVMRALTPEAVRHFFPTMERMTGRLLQRWQEALDAGRQPAVARDLKAWAMDIVMALSFDAGMVKLHFTNTKSSIGTGVSKATMYGVSAPLGSSASVGFEMGTGDTKTIASTTTSKLKGSQLAFNYSLSKRTIAYFRQGSSSETTAAGINAAKASTTAFGISHNF
jgi:hypothetical protein